MGIAEANMIGTAAGLAFTGKHAVSLQLRLLSHRSLRHHPSERRLRCRRNVRLVGTHAGVGIGDDGHSQMGLEDVTLMRASSDHGCFQPMDARETEPSWTIS